MKQVALSSICYRREKSMKNRTRLVNAAILMICSRNNWLYIDNDNIGNECLAKDGLHLNNKGVEMFHTNIHKCIDNALVRD